MFPADAPGTYINGLSVGLVRAELSGRCSGPDAGRPGDAARRTDVEFVEVALTVAGVQLAKRVSGHRPSSRPRSGDRLLGFRVWGIRGIRMGLLLGWHEARR